LLLYIIIIIIIIIIMAAAATANGGGGGETELKPFLGIYTGAINKYIIGNYRSYVV